MKLYLPEDKMNKPYISPHSSGYNGIPSNPKELIRKLSGSQGNFSSANASK